MNPNRHRAIGLRRRALEDQNAGLTLAAAGGEAHVAARLDDTRLELSALGALHVSGNKMPDTHSLENPVRGPGHVGDARDSEDRR